MLDNLYIRIFAQNNLLPINSSTFSHTNRQTVSSNEPKIIRSFETKTIDDLERDKKEAVIPSN